MGWWTDLKHTASKVGDRVEQVADAIVPGSGSAIAAIGDATAYIGDGVRDKVGSSDRAPSAPPPPPSPALRAPSIQQAADINGTQVWQVTARAQLGKWTPSEIPTLNDNALYELKEGGKAPAYPGLIWDAAGKTYRPDPKGTPVVKTVVRNGREMSQADADFLDKRDVQWTAEADARKRAADGPSADELALAKKRRMWMWVGAGVGAAALAALLMWALSSNKKA